MTYPVTVVCLGRAAQEAPPVTASLAERIAALESELLTLRQQQREQFLLIIARRIGPGVAFSALELLDHARVDPVLADVIAPASTTPKQLGRRLRTLAGAVIGVVRLVRVDRNADGCIWSIDIHEPSGVALIDGA
jgi:hypothetical protein